ncbi:NTPase [Thermotoga sp. KOL6]|uniref:NTPase n=1 Tax=Thermotoga sp. KOL6 TaxID=126741 RepID=UPI000C78199D|nr:NTPase [Thermotoga sp. KOL6]PLV58659.1 AAA family ATPase [Thermotoga sp. KOL6]
MIILITGRPGVGKTTLIKKLARLLQNAGGFYTEEIREAGKRVGFKILTLDGKEGLLARVGFPSVFRVGKYGVNLRDLEKIGVKALEKAIAEKDIVIIDEIGKMELFSDKFRQVVEKAFDSGKDVIATIKKSKDNFLDKLKNKKGVIIFEMNEKNRDRLFDEIAELFMLKSNRGGRK